MVNELIEELDTVRIIALNVIGTVVDIGSGGIYTVEFVDDDLPIGAHDKHILYHCRSDEIEFYHKGPVLAVESSKLPEIPPKRVECPVLKVEIDDIDCIENREIVDGNHGGRFFPDGFDKTDGFESICKGCRWHVYN